MLIKVTKEELKVGDEVQARQSMVNLVRDEKGVVTGTKPWDGDYNEENKDNAWFTTIINQEDFDKPYPRNWGHNDWFSIFDRPLRRIPV